MASFPDSPPCVEVDVGRGRARYTFACDAAARKSLIYQLRKFDVTCVQITK